MAASPKKRARKEAAGEDVAPRGNHTRVPSMRDVAGPFDPFADQRKIFVDSKDSMMQVCGWMTRAWREDDALSITGVNHAEWGRWKIEHPDEFTKAKSLGQAMIVAEIRGVALGITTRRGQAASQKLLTELLGAKDPPKKKMKAEQSRGVQLGKIEEGMGEFSTDELEAMAYGDNDPNTAGRAS